jgi:hypothetical protein
VLLFLTACDVISSVGFLLSVQNLQFQCKISALHSNVGFLLSICNSPSRKQERKQIENLCFRSISQVQPNLVKRERVKRDFSLRGTQCFASWTSTPYNLRWFCSKRDNLLWSWRPAYRDSTVQYTNPFSDHPRNRRFPLSDCLSGRRTEGFVWELIKSF